MRIEKRDSDLARKFVNIGVDLTKLFIVSLVLQHPDTDSIDDERLLFISNRIIEFYMNDSLNTDYSVGEIVDLIIKNYKDIKDNELNIAEIIQEFY